MKVGGKERDEVEHFKRQVLAGTTDQGKDFILRH